MRNDKSGHHEVVSTGHSHVMSNHYGSDYGSYGGYNINVGQTEKPIREYAAVFLRYWWIVVLCTSVGLAGAIVKNKRTPKIYKSAAIISIGSYVPPLEGPMAEILRSETTKADYISSQLPLLQSYVLAISVLKENAEIRNYFDPSLVTAEKVVNESTGEDSISIPMLDKYLESTSYSQVSNSSLVKITAQSTKRELASKIANAHAEGFVSLVRGQRLQSATVNVDFLKNRSKESEARVKSISEKIYQLSIKSGVNFSEESAAASEKGEMIRSLANNLSQARLKRSEEESVYKELSSNSGSSRLTVLNPDPNIQLRLFEISQVQNEYKAIKKLNSRAPYLKFLEEKIDLAKGTIKQFVERQAREQEIKYKAAANQERLIEKEFQKLRENETEKTKQLIEYKVLEKELRAAKEINDQIARRLEDAMVNAENGQKNVQILDKALIPVYPSSLNTMATLISGILLGVMLGVSLAFLLDFRDNSIKSVADLKRSLDSPVLGVIPNFSSEFKGNNTLLIPEENDKFVNKGIPVNDQTIIDSNDEFMGGPISEDENSTVKQTVKQRDLSELTIIEAKDFDLTNNVTKIGPRDHTQMFSETKVNSKASLIDMAKNLVGKENKKTKIKLESKTSEIVLLSSPLSRESESFRGIRASIQCSGLTEIPHKIMVTSGQKGDGKSTVAVNLATTFAQASIKTLLIDADLRIPSMYKFFDCERNTPGLVDYLNGEVDYTDVIMESPVPSLHVLLAGHHTRTPGELLSSRQMVELIELLSMEYDQIIIDTPPVCHVADALLLSKLVDAVALVVRSNKTPRPVAEYAYSRLKQVHAPILGTILNAASKIASFREPEYYYIEEQYTEKQ